MTNPKKEKSISQLEKELAAIETQLREGNPIWGSRPDAVATDADAPNWGRGARRSAREFLTTVACIEHARHRRDMLLAELVEAVPQQRTEHRIPNPANILPVRAGLSTSITELTGSCVNIHDSKIIPILELGVLLSAYDADPEWSALRDRVVELWERRALLTIEINSLYREATKLARSAAAAEESFIEQTVAKAKASLPDSIQGLFNRAKALKGDK